MIVENNRYKTYKLTNGKYLMYYRFEEDPAHVLWEVFTDDVGEVDPGDCTEVVAAEVEIPDGVVLFDEGEL